MILDEKCSGFLCLKSLVLTKSSDYIDTVIMELNSRKSICHQWHIFGFAYIVWFLVWKFCVYLSLCPFAFTLKWLSDGVGRTVEIKYFEQFARRVLFYFIIKIHKISKRLRETRIFQRNLWIHKTLFTNLCIILSCECINAFHRRRLGELKVWPQVLMMSSGNTRAMNHLSLIFLSFDLHAL